jgi:hypothetical protein
MVVDAAVAPTCTETGLTEGSHCTRCDHVVAQEVVDALGHNFVNGECECGEKDPEYVAPEEDKPGEDKPGEDKPGEDKPSDNVPELTLVQKILKAITDFLKKVKDFFVRIFKK